jgi:hypothetical protein
MDKTSATRLWTWAPGLIVRLTIILAAAALDTTRVAAAGEARFGVDGSLDLAELTRTGRVVMSIERVGNVYTLDASAVIRVDAQRLLGVSLGYERYAEIGVPNLRASRVVSGAPDGNLLYTWNWMSCFGQTSKHYLAVRVVRNLTIPGAAGIRWELAPRRPAWSYEEAPAFQRLDGSWYLEPLPDGAVYARYFMVAVLDPTLPEGLRAWVVKGQLRDGTRGVIQALAREAARSS